MKKLFLITIILLLQSFPSFGNPNGNGILCTYGNESFSFYDKGKKLITKIGFIFINNKVTLNVIDRNTDEVVIRNGYTKDVVRSLTKIEWGSKKEKWELDRKTLKLKNIQNKKIVYEIQCEVYSQKIYLEKFEEMREQFENFYYPTLKDNKI